MRVVDVQKGPYGSAAGGEVGGAVREGPGGGAPPGGVWGMILGVDT